jgi:hypothetical protein
LIDCVDQSWVNDLVILGNIFLNWLRWEVEISTAREQCSHTHPIDNCIIKIIVGLLHPLRSGCANSLSRTISVGAGRLNEHHRVGGF